MGKRKSLRRCPTAGERRSLRGDLGGKTGDPVRKVATPRGVVPALGFLAAVAALGSTARPRRSGATAY